MYCLLANVFSSNKWSKPYNIHNIITFVVVLRILFCRNREQKGNIKCCRKIEEIDIEGLFVGITSTRNPCRYAQHLLNPFLGIIMSSGDTAALLPSPTCSIFVHEKLATKTAALRRGKSQQFNTDITQQQQQHSTNNNISPEP